MSLRLLNGLLLAAIAAGCSASGPGPAETALDPTPMSTPSALAAASPGEAEETRRALGYAIESLGRRLDDTAHGILTNRRLAPGHDTVLTGTGTQLLKWRDQQRHRFADAERTPCIAEALSRFDRVLDSLDGLNDRFADASSGQSDVDRALAAIEDVQRELDAVNAALPDHCG